jgi:hypothetical protein
VAAALSLIGALAALAVPGRPAATDEAPIDTIPAIEPEGSS